MDTVLYSWLGTAAIAPFVGLLASWTLVVFYNYKSRWRLVDVFLCSLTTHEIIFSLFGFGFSVLSIIRPMLDYPCSFMVWGLGASRLFHLSGLTSLLLDRALSSKFPYTYRYSVKKSQVQYHLAVLGIIAVFMGVTSVFARVPSVGDGTCSLHPLAWNVKFSVFLSSVYGMLMLTGFACCCVVATSKETIGVKKCLPPMFNYASGRSSTSSNNSSNVLKEEWNDQKDDEWRIVASICWMSYFINHGPFLVLSILGILVPTFWTPWLDNITIWLSILQGILLPLMLLLADIPHRNAVKDMMSQPGRIYRHLSDHSGFRLQIADVYCPEANISPTLMMNCNSNCHSSFKVPHRLRWTPNSVCSLQSLNLSTTQKSPNLFGPRNDSITKTELPRCLSPLPPLDKDIYSSLDSSCYSLLSSASSKDSLDRQIDEDSISITTNALDDFEFHGGGGTDSLPLKNTIYTIEESSVDDIDDNILQNAKMYQNCSFGRGESNRSFTKDYKSSPLESKFDNSCFMPNFSCNNLVFLSPKPFKGQGGSFRNFLSENTTGMNNVPRCLNLDSSVNNCYRDTNNHQVGYGPTVNEQWPTKDNSVEDRLIIYSEYL